MELKKCILTAVCSLGGLFVVMALQQEEYIMTVTGKIAPEALGRTLVHEHIITNFQGTPTANQVLLHPEQAYEEILPHLRELWEQGYNSLVECTPAFIGRNAGFLRELSEKSGLQILTNTGSYAAVDKKYLPDAVFSKTAEELAGMWEQEWLRGIGGTGIRPGFIKLGVGSGPLDATEEKIVRAGFLLSKRSGLTVYVHTGGDLSIRSQYELAQESGFNPGKLVWVHAQNGTDSTRIEMAKQGIWVSLDGLSAKSVDSYVHIIDEFRHAGLLNRLLISHDDGWSLEQDDPELVLSLFDNGNSEPFRSIEVLLLPRLRGLGFHEEEINQLLVENPRSALTITK